MRLMLSRMRSPIRRVLALDAGSRCIRMLLAQSEFGRFRVLKEELIDLHEEGLVSEQEVGKLIEEETLKLSGVSESRIVHDFIPSESTVAGRQHFWVTLCREED